MTDVQICNLALARIGQRQFVTSASTDTTPAGKLCAVLYTAARDSLLTSHRWAFATRHADLSLVSPSETRSGWTYVYALPDDCLEAHYLFSGARPGQPTLTAWSAYSDVYGVTTVSQLPAINGSVPNLPFAIEASADGTGRVLLADQVDAELVYTAALTDAGAFPQPFAEALAWRLAQDLALCLPVEPQLAMGLEAKAQRALLTAKAQAMREAGPDIRPDSAAIAIRG